MVSVALKKMEIALLSAGDDWEAASSIFSEYIASRDFEQTVLQELSLLSTDPLHIVSNCVGQVNFLAISNDSFDFTIKFAAPFPRSQYNVKWLGSRQLLSAIPNSGVSVRTWSLPDAADINLFQPEMSAVESANCGTGTATYPWSAKANQILDVSQATGTSALFSLTERRSDVDLIWTLDPDRSPIYAEAARLTTTRIQTILEVADAMGTPVPSDVLNSAALSRDPILQTFLLERSVRRAEKDAFKKIYEGMQSTSPIIRERARTLFDLLL